VLVSHVRTMITVTLAMISKTLRTPDLTTIQDALSIMQPEAKGIAKETANVIETVKMEVRNNAADIKRSIKIREETKTAAREATESSKMVMDIVKELKDKAPPIRPQGHMSYAAVAANGVLASGTPDAHRVKAASL
jgi:septin family protein